MADASSAYAELAASRGLEQLPSFDPGPLTPLIVEAKGQPLHPAARGSLGEGVDGVVGQLAYTRNKTFRFHVALTEIPAATAFAPRVFCIRRGRSTRDDEFYGFEARHSKLWTESTALNERFDVSTSPYQDPNWLRQLFSPSFVDWLGTKPPADFSFELAYGALLGSIEEDDPGAAGLAALCDATAHVADRISRECEE
ncbi:MAG: hypothetical protein ACJ76B_02120 [Solirubrobacterales bacterium]